MVRCASLFSQLIYMFNRQRFYRLSHMILKVAIGTDLSAGRQRSRGYTLR